MICNVRDAYDSSRALLLDVLLPEGRALGWFVALPSRDQLLVLPVSPQSLAFVYGMKRASESNFKDAPYAISPDIFWVHEGKWWPFPVDVDGERVLLEPPEEFREVLERLMPADEETDEEAPEE